MFKLFIRTLGWQGLGRGGARLACDSDTICTPMSRDTVLAGPAADIPFSEKYRYNIYLLSTHVGPVRRSEGGSGAGRGRAEGERSINHL